MIKKKKRPVLRYHGGKWRLAPWIISHFPPHKVYVEPYGGAASVLIQKPRSHGEIYNDLDSEIVNVFRVLRNPVGSELLIKNLELTPFSREEFDSAYEETDDPIERVRKTIVKSFMGFGTDSATRPYSTGFRINKNQYGVTPALDWARYPEALRLIIGRFIGVSIENRPALDVIKKQDKENTLFYLDPPYLHELRYGGNKHGYRFELTEEDHKKLAAQLLSLKGMVVISGYPSELYDDLYGGWYKTSRESFAYNANKRLECLWISPSAIKKLNKPMFGKYEHLKERKSHD